MPKKTYRAERHDIVRAKQASNADEVHHPDEKINQLVRNLEIPNNLKDFKILELFAGQGNLTKVYEKYGVVDKYDIKYYKTGDSYIVFHRLIGEKRKYNLIDLDPYGFPSRFFPDIFLLIDDGYLVLTMPKPYVNIANGITKATLFHYYGTPSPTEHDIIERIKIYSLCHWRQSELIESIDLGRLWRMMFRVKRVKATDYTGVRNR